MPTAEPTPSVQIGDGLAAIVLGDTVISLWREPATTLRWSWQLAVQQAAVERLPAGAIAVSLILESSSPLDAKLRAQMQADFKRLETHLRKLIAVPLQRSRELTRVCSREMVHRRAA